ncbi:bifunctional 3,4-dihydroxy-2-butanone-4-phosphate synthase/GTP cyclohydrolase II [Oryzihumus sp.]|uniref:bifunctional 3,4-dihydroxy-2-butanone-4-phosphate synthase/GTP cyclohydrolase II n=1 Tax=Oryzihumus sp. TaxID=1968903 RepID=UPI002ED97C7B
MTTALSTVEEALDALRRGLPVLVTDDEDRENEGDVILAAQTATEQWLAWTIRWSSGVVCAPMPDEVADRLELPPMVSRNEDPRGTAYTISVDAREGVSTGISAADRARTVNLLADPATEASDLVRPGHVFPLRAREGGVLVRAGHTEAAVDLCRLAGLSPVGVIAELVHDDGAMMRLPAVLELGAKHELPVITIEQLIAWRQRNDRVEKIVETRLPTVHGEFRVHGYRDMVTGDEHVALVSPKGIEGRAPLARLHSECLTGDVFGSQRCDCGPQLERAMERVGREGGVIVYLRGHEGRGVGLLHKLRAYALQDKGFDTVDAQVELGLPIDAREYAAGAAILADLGLHAVRLLTNNPLKVNAMRDYDIDVVAVERLSIVPGEDNEHYLRTKRDRMGHDLVIEATDKGASA